MYETSSVNKAFHEFWEPEGGQKLVWQSSRTYDLQCRWYDVNKKAVWALQNPKRIGDFEIMVIAESGVNHETEMELLLVS